jgi:ribosomal protein S18 acetylase RimI-like enzyme
MQRRHVSVRPLAQSFPVAQLGILDGEPLYIRQARPADFPTIVSMISDARERLKHLGTDQWSTDWSGADGRKRIDRVRRSIAEGKTWLAVHALRHRVSPAAIPVATVTVEETANRAIWPDAHLAAESAVYLSRLVTAKGFSGLHIGTAVMDWAGRHGLRRHSAKWVRIDVWTTNSALHSYYEKRGFSRCGVVPDVTYPARSRFQRPASYELGDGPPIYEFGAPCDTVDRAARWPGPDRRADGRDRRGRPLRPAPPHGWR